MAKKNTEKKEDKPKKRGLPKGRTNNPNGRPKGSSNILTRAIKEKLVKRLDKEGFVDKVVDELFALEDGVEFLNQSRHLYPYILSRAISEEEEEALINPRSVLFERLSPKANEE